MVHGLFLTGGQRGALSLESILLFTTGSTSEPLLGFQLAPSIEFAECQSFLPIANMCVNRLILPRPSAFATLPGEAILYELYDYAFSNTFFGIK
ncbi:hypothetical protein FSP39_020477 [Pinctada imbricata]|uniref:HECT domain-containing protein n=1 Tax=Pinctada imbricata TaxID=66713 RepID=A0AA88YUC7_PINIB|nr:hypothetical protein FSP39_020477 [Pinctada imbricata]